VTCCMHTDPKIERDFCALLFFVFDWAKPFLLKFLFELWDGKTLQVRGFLSFVAVVIVVVIVVFLTQFLFRLSPGPF
jgi:hypothetical protein